MRLIGDLRDLRDDPPAWRSLAIETLSGFLGAQQGSFLHLTNFHPEGTPALLDATHAGWIDHAAATRWEHEIQAGHTEADPQLVHAVMLPGNVVAMCRPEIVNDEEFYKSELVRAFNSVVKIDGHVAGWCRIGGANEVLAFTFHRAWGDRPATERQRNLLRLFMDELHLLWQTGKLQPRKPTAPSVVPRLSSREVQVLDCLMAGDSVKQAAAKLGLSHRTVEGYVKALHRKANVTSRGELLARFMGRPR